MSEMPAVLTVDQVIPLIPRRMGLIVGPGVTLGDGAIRRIAQAAWRHLNSSSDIAASVQIGSIGELLDERSKPEQVRASIRAVVAAEKPQGQVFTLAHNRWAAVLSLTIDHHLEVELGRWCESHVSRPTVTVVQDIRRLQLPPRTIPVYKLMGSVLADDFPLTALDYRVRTSLWQPVLRDFAEHIQGSGVLCVGVDHEANVLLDFFAPMLANPKLLPGPFLMLADDPVSSSPAVRELERGGLRVHRVRADIGALMKLSASQEKAGFTQLLDFSESTKTLAEQLRPFSDVGVIIPSVLPRSSSVQKDVREVHRLRELLFSPTLPNWEPYSAGLDFRRSITAPLISKIKSLVTSFYWENFEVRVRGAASVGKTTVLKRAAFDLALEGRTVMWLRPYPFQDGPIVLKQIFDKLRNAKKGDGIIVFVDDP